jgi:hypothetical protein
MEDGLLSVLPAVQYGPESVVRKAVLFGQQGRDILQPAQHLNVVLGDLYQGGYVPTRDHQQMSGRLWVDVAKRYDVFIFVNDFARYLFGYDSAKDTLFSWHQAILPKAFCRVPSSFVAAGKVPPIPAGKKRT